MWIIIAAVLGGLVALWFALLSVPLEMSASYDSSRKPAFRLRILWLFGLVSRDLNKPGTEKPTESKRRRKRPRFSDMVKIISIPGLWGKFLKLVRDIFRRIKLKDLDINLRIGLDDPADTGLLFAAIWPLTYFPWMPERYPVRLEPCFQEAMFEGHALAELRIFPIMLIPAFCRFVFSRPAFKAWKIMAFHR